MSEIRIYKPNALDADEWRKLQSIARLAYLDSLPDRSKKEIDTLVNWQNPTLFMKSHLNPNSEVGKHFNANQIYHNPRVAVALEANEPVGFAYGAQNISGNSKKLKRISIVKDYYWIR